MGTATEEDVAVEGEASMATGLAALNSGVAEAVKERNAETRTPEEEARVDDIMDSWRAAAESAEIEPYRPTQFPKISEWNQLTEMAEGLARAASLPEALRNKPADVALLLLVARDVGIKPTTALNRIHVIKGRPTMSAELMRALVLDRGHDIWFDEVSDSSVTICGHRKEWPAERVVRVTWTLEDAKRAKLIQEHDGLRVTKGTDKRDPWIHYTRAMLKARATSEVVRDVFPDVVTGVSYTPEEMDAAVGEDGEPIKIASTAWHENSSSAPTYEPAPQLVLDAFRAQIDSMSDEERAVVGAKWKELRLHRLEPVGPDSKIPEGSDLRRLLAIDEIDLAASAIAEAKRVAAADAEVVDPEEAAEAAAGSEAAEPAPIPVEKAQALVEGLEPEQRVELLRQFGIVPEQDADTTERLVGLLTARVICGRCAALREGPEMAGEALCGCES